MQREKLGRQAVCRPSCGAPCTLRESSTATLPCRAVGDTDVALEGTGAAGGRVGSRTKWWRSRLRTCSRRRTCFSWCRPGFRYDVKGVNQPEFPHPPSQWGAQMSWAGAWCTTVVRSPKKRGGGDGSGRGGGGDTRVARGAVRVCEREAPRLSSACRERRRLTWSPQGYMHSIGPSRQKKRRKR